MGYADVGRFGGDPAWQALAGVNYAFNDKVTGKLGYRRYKVDYDKNNFKYDPAMYGVHVVWASASEVDLRLARPLHEKLRARIHRRVDARRNRVQGMVQAA